MQAKILGITAAAALGGGAWFMAGPGDGVYYPMAQGEVASRLATASFPGMVDDQFASSGDLVAHAYKRGTSEVVWEFTAARRPLATFTAALEPKGEGTMVTVDFTMADSKLGDAALEDIGEGREFMVGVLELGMEEHIAATLESRKFDSDAFGRKLAGYALAHRDQARKFIRRMAELDAGGGGASERAMRKAIEEEVAWHGPSQRSGTRGTRPRGQDVSGYDPKGYDPKGFDPTPPKGGW